MASPDAPPALCVQMVLPMFGDFLENVTGNMLGIAAAIEAARGACATANRDFIVRLTMCMPNGDMMDVIRRMHPARHALPLGARLQKVREARAFCSYAAQYMHAISRACKDGSAKQHSGTFELGEDGLLAAHAQCIKLANSVNQVNTKLGQLLTYLQTPCLKAEQRGADTAKTLSLTFEMALTNLHRLPHYTGPPSTTWLHRPINAKAVALPTDSTQFPLLSAWMAVVPPTFHDLIHLAEKLADGSDVLFPDYVEAWEEGSDTHITPVDVRAATLQLAGLDASLNLAMPPWGRYEFVVHSKECVTHLGAYIHNAVASVQRIFHLTSGAARLDTLAQSVQRWSARDVEAARHFEGVSRPRHNVYWVGLPTDSAWTAGQAEVLRTAVQGSTDEAYHMGTAPAVFTALIPAGGQPQCPVLRALLKDLADEDAVLEPLSTACANEEGRSALQAQLLAITCAM
jgi:hypothetical protein